MHFPVFLDTCVLYPIVLTDTLLRVAEQQVFRPYWSPDVMAELQRNLGEVAPVGPDGARRRIEAMNRAFPDAIVSGYEALIDGMECDPKDRHVMAAAVHSECQVVVTYNLKDFPPEAMAKHHLEAVHPDVFLLDQLDLYPRPSTRPCATSRRSQPGRSSLLFNSWRRSRSSSSTGSRPSCDADGRASTPAAGDPAGVARCARPRRMYAPPVSGERSIGIVTRRL